MEKKSQCDNLYELLKSGDPMNTDTIIREVYPAEGRLRTPARISARIFDVKHKYGVEIKSWQDKDIQGLWWYQIEQDTPLDAQNCDIARVNDQQALFLLPEIEPKFQMPD